MSCLSKSHLNHSSHLPLLHIPLPPPLHNHASSYLSQNCPYMREQQGTNSNSSKHLQRLRHSQSILLISSSGTSLPKQYRFVQPVTRCQDMCHFRMCPML